MIRDDLKRIKWRLSGNGWKANERDMEAFNHIVDHITNDYKEVVNENENFAKLYIYLYIEFLRYFDCTVYEKHPEKTIQRILKRSMDVLISDLTYTVNQQNLYDRLKENGFIFGHPMRLDEDVKKMNIEIIEKTKGEKFTEEEVTDNITAIINNALNI